jgi:hypothetical protein
MGRKSSGARSSVRNSISPLEEADAGVSVQPVCRAHANVSTRRPHCLPIAYLPIEAFPNITSVDEPNYGKVVWTNA